jgi:type II secretory pathway predicted ATPase ExeA
MDNTKNKSPVIKPTTSGCLYLDFYDLNEPPFSLTPDPAFLYFSQTHKSVLEKILYGISNKLGFFLLIGEVGTGKTTICRSILDTLEEKAETVYIINPSVSGKELISIILDDLGLSYPPETTKKDLVDNLNDFLLSSMDAKPVVIIIDDAQTMPIDALEDLRLLSNLETDKMKLIQMLLVGQQELIDLINRPEMRQLKQRIAIQCHLEFLNKDEVGEYISRRLFISGDKGRIRFTSKGIKLIYKFSRIPRLINKICDYSLVAGYLSNDFTIKDTHVKQAMEEIGNMGYMPKKADTMKIFTFARLPFFILFGLSLMLLFIMFPRNQLIDFTDKKTRNLKIATNNTKKDVLSSTEKMPTKTADDTKSMAPSDVSRSTYPYTIQLVSVKTMKRVKRALSIYEDKGLKPHWNHVNVQEKGTWFRLLVGCFSSMKEGEQFQKEHGLVNSLLIKTPYAVSLAQDESSSDFEQIKSILNENQYDCYRVKNEDGTERLLLAGVFMTQESAEKTARGLAKIGVMARAAVR